MPKRRLKPGQRVGIKSGGRVSPAIIQSVSLDGALVRVEIDSLPGSHLIAAVDLFRTPSIKPRKSANAGKMNNRTFHQIVDGLRRTKPPEEAQPPEYTPQIVFDARMSDYSGYAVVTIAVKATQCPFCGELILPPLQPAINTRLDMFVKYGEYSVTNDRVICKKCIVARPDWICCLCNEHKTVGELKVQGSHEVGLCNICFGEVSAKRWEEAVEEIHRRDYGGFD